MQELNSPTKGKLDLEVPTVPRKVLLYGTACDASDNGTEARKERSPQNSILLFIWKEHVGDHTHGNRSTGQR
jgi:hypothetical protein